jgi:hypothetical protein
VPHFVTVVRTSWDLLMLIFSITRKKLEKYLELQEYSNIVDFANITGGNELQIFSNFTLEQGSTTNFLEGDSLILATCTTQSLALPGGSNVSLIKQLKFELSQSITPFNGSSSLTIFDPDQINFDYNDYNPLLDNAETPQYSTVWMDVDYSQNPLVPVNFGLIISGTADRAFVQDSNYSSKAWSNLRYNGSRTNSFINI